MSCSSVLKSSNTKSNGTKLRRLLLDGGTQVLRDLFDYKHPPNTLSGFLKTHEKAIKSKSIIRFDDQIALLFPSDGQPDSKTFDITLLSSLLQNFCGLKAPTTGWNKEPPHSDKSQEANIVRIKLFRNKLQHRPNSEINDLEFKELWNEISEPLKDLGLKDDEMNKLKSTPIDDDSPKIEKNFQRWCDLDSKVSVLEKDVAYVCNDVKKLRDEVREIKEQKEEISHPLQSLIPDEPVNFVGRKEFIEQILGTLKNTKTSIFISGSPGIGKSTLAKKVSWELSRKHQKIVFYIDLWKCKASEEGISKAIASVLCHGRLGEFKPKEVLDNWMINLHQEVILVLDNAEDVLDDSSTFADLLMRIRQNSRQQVRFFIASRDVVQLEMEIEMIELKPLTNEESVEVISLHSSGKHFSSSTNRDQKMAIAKLCCHSPLALCIVSSLLDDLEAEELIKQLELRVMDVLEGDDRRGRCCSVREAIHLSFDKLDNILRGYFVQVTAFAGPFTAESAAAVIELPKFKAAKILTKLVRKSLLHKEGNKYSIHPLIHTFVKNYGESNEPEKLKRGNINFVNYYASLFLNNARMYWTKDGCSQSISNFDADRINFEKALELSCLKAEPEEDFQAVWTEKSAFKQLRYLGLYLQSCIPWDQLEKVISCFIGLCEKKNLFAQQLELMCLTGHIIRRKSGNEEYEEIVKQSDRLFEKCKDTLDDSSLVYYKIAKARKLGHEQRREEAIIQFEEITGICKTKIDENKNIAADYAKAVCELGHNLKNIKKYEPALESLQSAVELYRNFLGKHTLTVLGLKDLADCYMSMGNFEDALLRYEEACEMLTSLNSGSSDTLTTSVLLYKNRGVCYRESKQYKESEECFNKAEKIAEKNLSGNHQYKFWVKADFAILYRDMDRKIEAKALAKEALDMGEKLKLTESGWRTFKTELENILTMQN